MDLYKAGQELQSLVEILEMEQLRLQNQVRLSRLHLLTVPSNSEMQPGLWIFVKLKKKLINIFGIDIIVKCSWLFSLEVIG